MVDRKGNIHSPRIHTSYLYTTGHLQTPEPKERNLSRKYLDGIVLVRPTLLQPRKYTPYGTRFPYLEKIEILFKLNQIYYQLWGFKNERIEILIGDTNNIRYMIPNSL